VEFDVRPPRESVNPPKDLSAPALDCRVLRLCGGPTGYPRLDARQPLPEGDPAPAQGFEAAAHHVRPHRLIEEQVEEPLLLPADLIELPAKVLGLRLDLGRADFQGGSRPL